MSKCEWCGNEYDQPIEVMQAGEKHTFDCFECAIASMAPTCHNCGVRVIGHGLQAHGQIFCCESCAEAEGIEGLRDRVD